MRVADVPRPSRAYVAATLVVVLALAAACVILASREWFYGDDFYFLRGAQTGRDWWHTFLPLGERGWWSYRPLTIEVYFSALFALAGLDPFPYLLASLVLHFASGAVVWRIARRLDFDPRVAMFVGAASVALYPSLEGSLFWASGFQTVAGCFFYVLCVALFLEYRLRNDRRFQAASVAAFVATLLSNELGMTLPGPLLLLGFHVAEGTFGARVRTALRASLPHLLLLLAYVPFRYLLIGPSRLPMPGGYYLPHLGWHVLSNVGGFFVLLLQATPAATWFVLALVALGSAVAAARGELGRLASLSLVLGGWLLATMVPFAGTWFIHARSAMPMEAPFCLLAGVFLDALVRASTPRRARFVELALVGALLAAILADAAAPRPAFALRAWTPSSPVVAVDFRSQVEPILRSRCYECHGSTERKGDLRLTNRKDALTPSESGIPVIVPGAADLSPLYELVSSSDPEERMPKDHDPLAPEEIVLLARWIDEGAEWPDEAPAHWAYHAPPRPPLPEVKDGAWPRSSIDRFVLASLEREGIAPAPEADPSTLVRRLWLDLVGLPPPPEDVEAFVADPSPERWDAMVDRLLASPGFGERWASSWLDLARYADSTGFMSEVMLSNWPYRDWVIDAINDDMPFDQFAIEQLAGDLLPDATANQKIATGFLRAAPLNLEAGVHEEDARIAQVFDRVNTLGSAMLGTTIECAQCHDHKYDPFTQRDYYRLLAFFDGTTKETAVFDRDGAAALRPEAPTLELPPLPEDVARGRDVARRLLDEVDAILHETLPEAPPITPEERAHVLEQAAAGRFDGIRPKTAALVQSRLESAFGADWWKPWAGEIGAKIREGAPRWAVQPVGSFSGSAGETHRVLDDGSILVESDVPEASTYVVEVETPSSLVTGFRIEGLADPALPGGGPGRGDPVLREFTLNAIEIALVDGEKETPLELAWTNASSAPQTAASAIDGDPATGWSAGALGGDQWIVVAPLRPVAAAGDGRTSFRITIRQATPSGKTIGRLRIQTTSADPSIVTLRGPLLSRLRDQTPEELSPADQTLVRTMARAGRLPELTPAFHRAAREIEEVPPPPRAHVVEELAEPRTTRVFERGDPQSPGDVVTPGTPASLPPMGSEPRNRLGLARWVASPANPLFARVAVNQWWGELFGRGLVATPEDFGTRGEPPTHPGLLDWLATELAGSGWSRKHMIREIVRSATYRQSALPADPGTLEKDPDNRLLARSPRLRLPAETIRDNALQIAGLLSPKRRGPPAHPPQPPGVWRPNGLFAVKYEPDRGEGRYRRGVYTVWRRTSPYPSFVAFDAGDRTSCVASRFRSNTPLQALTLLNDEVYVEAALSLADRVLRSRPSGSTDERIDWAFRLALARPPTSLETSVVRELLERPGADAPSAERPSPLAALAASAAGFAPSPGVDPDELARWFHATRVILNLEETITRG